MNSVTIPVLKKELRLYIPEYTVSIEYKELLKSFNQVGYIVFLEQVNDGTIKVYKRKIINIKYSRGERKFKYNFGGKMMESFSGIEFIYFDDDSRIEFVSVIR